MDRLISEINAEKEHLTKTFEALDMAMKRKQQSIIELAAIATFIHNSYNGIENLIKRIMKYKKISIPSSETWHKDLLTLSVDYKIVSLKLSDKLDEYRAFRHFFTHGYEINLDPKKLLPLANRLPKIWNQFQVELNDKLTYLKRENST